MKNTHNFSDIKSAASAEEFIRALGIIPLIDMEGNLTFIKHQKNKDFLDFLKLLDHIRPYEDQIIKLLRIRALDYG